RRHLRARIARVHAERDDRAARSPRNDVEVAPARPSRYCGAGGRASHLIYAPRVARLNLSRPRPGLGLAWITYTHSAPACPRGQRQRAAPDAARAGLDPW